MTNDDKIEPLWHLHLQGAHGPVLEVPFQTCIALLSAAGLAVPAVVCGSLHSCFKASLQL